MSAKHVISIVVPVYKVERYIEKCLDSILSQTFTDFELILVDDGSPDSCPNICDEYAKKDSRINVIHKKNGGLSDARNAGIDAATGEYIGFIDSDDYISPDMFEVLYRCIKEHNADIAVCGFIVVNENDSVTFTNNREVRVMDSSVALHEMICNRMFSVNAWNKLYKKDLFKEIRYPVGVMYEDLAITYRLIDRSASVVVNSSKLYAYVQRNGSIMNNTRFNVSEDKIKIVSDMLEYFDSADSELNAGIIRYLIHDIYKMASTGTLTGNKAFSAGIKIIMSQGYRYKGLTIKERVILRMVYLCPWLLQSIYKTRGKRS